MPSFDSFGEIRQALLEFAYEPESFNVDAVVADIIEMARRVEA
jgi:hypothetical protein